MHMQHNASFAAPLNICYVLAAFPVLSETFVSNEVRAMRRLGHTILPVALAPYDGPCQPEDEALRDGTVALGTIPTMRAAADTARNPAGIAAAMRFARTLHALPTKSLLRAAVRVAYTARQAGCTHIHAHYAHVSAATAIAAARIAGLTCSFMAHGYDVYGSPTDLTPKLAAADLVIATCNDMAADFRRMAPGVRTVVLPCGTDPSRFTPAFDQPSNGRLLAIGRLVPQKGYPVLLAALARLAEADRPVIDAVGGGPLEDELRAQAQALGIAPCINFLGRRPSDWIAAEGPRYQGFVAPYVVCDDNDRDTSPVAVKEAMAMGLPVIASYLMGMKEDLDPSCGGHVTPGDAGELAAALHWLATRSPAERRALGEAGRHRALTHFTLSAQAAGITAAIRALPAHGARVCAA